MRNSREWIEERNSFHCMTKGGGREEGRELGGGNWCSGITSDQRACAVSCIVMTGLKGSRVQTADVRVPFVG